MPKRKIKKRTNGRTYNYARIRELKCYDHVMDMIYAGFPLGAIARYIRDNGEYTDVGFHSLVIMLGRFRSSLGEGEFIRRSLPKVFERAAKNFSDRLEDLRRMEDLLADISYVHAELMGDVKLNGVPVDSKYNIRLYRTYKALADTIYKMHNMKMDLGLTGSRDLGTINVTAEMADRIRQKYGDGAAKAFDNPVARSRVLAALGAARRAGKLRNVDGSPMKLSEHMNLSEDEARIIDAEYTDLPSDDADNNDNGVEEEQEEEQDNAGGERNIRKPDIPEIELEPATTNESNLPPGPRRAVIKKRVTNSSS